jgi:hypothetical protein
MYFQEDFCKEALRKTAVGSLDTMISKPFWKSQFPLAVRARIL